MFENKKRKRKKNQITDVSSYYLLTSKYKRVAIKHKRI